MNFDQDHIDELFRNTLENQAPEVPQDVMNKVLNQWQQLTQQAGNTSAGEQAVGEGVKYSEKIITSAGNSSTTSGMGWLSVGKILALPKTVLGISIVAVSAGLAIYLVRGLDTVTTASKVQPSSNNQQDVSIAPDNSSINSNFENKTNKEAGDFVENPLNSLESPLRTDANSTKSNFKPMDSKQESAAGLESTNQKNSGTVGNTPISNTRKLVDVLQNPVDGLKSADLTALIQVVNLENGWVQMTYEGRLTEKSYIDWGDGKIEKVKTNVSNKWVANHRYFPRTNQKFVVALVEYRDIELKSKSTLAKTDVYVQSSMEEEIIPEIITPNGDGYNDEFYIKIALPEYFELLIFDKNNTVVFRSNSPEERWAARDKNQAVMEGEYRILLTLKYSGESSHRFIRKRLIVQQ